MPIKVLSNEEIEEAMKIISEEYDEKMARIFYIHAKKDQQVHKWKTNHLLPNLKRCIECEFSTVVYDVNGNFKKIECSKGCTLRDMIKDYCIVEV